MMQKTIRGKKCPQCSSFIKADQDKCNVCGFVFETEEGPENEPELPVTIKTGSNSIVCPKCKTDNNPEFKFCKICKHPLKEVTQDEIKPGKKLRLTFDWLKSDLKEYFENELDFNDFPPYFDGCLLWEGYAFCVYQNKKEFEILARKIDTSAAALLYKKCPAANILSSGQDFFLGAVKIKLLGDINSQKELKTMVSSDKTVFVGPGESLDDHSVNTGLPRLIILDMDLKEDTIEINGKTLLGRDSLGKNTDLDFEVMRKSGVSNEHVYLTPLPGSKWLIEPLPNKPIFSEICQEPVILHNGEMLRFVSGHQVGEFKIGIKKTRI
jgi:rubredoxin